jgi:hypothetical protein
VLLVFSPNAAAAAASAAAAAATTTATTAVASNANLQQHNTNHTLFPHPSRLFFPEKQPAAVTPLLPITPTVFPPFFIVF